MAEVFVEFQRPVTAEDGKIYTARACGGQMASDSGRMDRVHPGERRGSRSFRTRDDAAQQEDTIYWATGLTPVFLEGSLHRALNPTVRPIARPLDKPHFDGPAEPFVTAAARTESILDPFSVYRKGEALLRRQLSALAGWHLVNIIRHYGLSDEGSDRLSAREPVQLVEMIIDAVRTPQSAPR